MPGDSRQRLTIEQLRARAATRIAKYKTATNTEIDAAREAVAHLLRDVFKYRERSETPPDRENESAVVAGLRRDIETLEEENERLIGSVPATGAVVLSGDDVKVWQSVSKLLSEAKLTPEKLAERVTLASTLEGKEAERAARSLLEDGAKALGWKPSVFADLAELKKLHVEMRDATVKKRDAAGNELNETEIRKLPFVRPLAEANAPLVLASEYVTKDAKDYLPALTAQDEKGDGHESGSETGLRIPTQPGNPRTPAPTNASAYVARTYVTPSQRRAAASEAK